MEKYRLSGQYNPEKLLKVYRESIQTELKNYSMLEYNMFRNADITFPETDLMRMVIEDTMIARDKAGELKRILEKIFTERCGLPVEVQVEYKEARKRRREEEPVIVPFPGRAGQGQAADAGNGGYDRAGAAGAGADGYYQSDGGEAPPWETDGVAGPGAVGYADGESMAGGNAPGSGFGAAGYGLSLIHIWPRFPCDCGKRGFSCFPIFSKKFIARSPNMWYNVRDSNGRTGDF